MKSYSESEMLHRMAVYCSTAERCKDDIRKKMEIAGMPDEAIERTLAYLVKEKFIDEERYARSFVNDKLRFNKWGRVRINYELCKKNLPPSLCKEVLESVEDATWQSVLFSLLEAKKKTIRVEDEREAFGKLLRFAAGRGFESRETLYCLRRLYNGNNYADDWE
jgi:regulatory protein